MQPVPITLDPIVRGDTWDGIPELGPIEVDGAEPMNACTSVRMYFRHSVLDISPAYVLRSSPGAGEGAFTIENAATWLFSVPAQTLPLPAGTWKWDIEMTDSVGGVYTFYAGTLFVAPDVSY